jgi:hypothetical protein
MPALDGTAPAYSVNAELDEGAVRKLATALGVDGTVDTQPGGWSVGPTLYVQAVGSWGYSPDAMSGVSSGSASVSATCAPDGVCTSEEPPVTTTTAVPGLPGKDDATAIVRKMLEKAGSDLDGWTPKTEELPGVGWAVTFSRKLDGHEVLGFDQAGVVGAHGKIMNANGTLASPTKVGDYPLVGTKAAFEQAKTTGIGVMLEDKAPAAPESTSESASASGSSSGSVSGSASASEPDPGPATPSGPDPGGSSTPSDPGRAIQPEPAPSGSTLPPQIVEVTGAEIVLQLTYGGCPGDAMYLVPSYRFRDAKATEVMGPVPAVDQKYLSSTTTAAKDPAQAQANPCGLPESREPDPATKVDGGPPVTG